MAFAAESGTVPKAGWALFMTAVLWTIAYDTFYAMVDREDDLKVGIKSTAILFGDMDLTIIAWLQGFTLLGLMLAGKDFGMGLNYYIALALAALLFYQQHRLTRDRDPASCFKAFLHNNRVGFVVFLGIVTQSLFPISMPF